MPGHRESSTNFSGQSRRVQLPQYRGADAWPLHNLKEGIEKFDGSLIGGEPSLAPQLVPRTVRLLVPPTKHQR